MHIRTHLHTHTLTHSHTHIIYNLYIHICIYAYIQTHTHTYTCTYACIHIFYVYNIFINHILDLHRFNMIDLNISCITLIFQNWLVVWKFYIFPHIGNNHPQWLIFFRGVETTSQIIWRWSTGCFRLRRDDGQIRLVSFPTRGGPLAAPGAEVRGLEALFDGKIHWELQVLLWFNLGRT